MKRFFLILLTLLFTVECVSASDSVLGSLISCDDGLTVADGTVYTENTYYSTQSGVGYQNEHYYTYTPNKNVVPVLYNGQYMYGKQTLSQASDAVRSQGLIPLMGVNAGFFSFQTGVPMSNVIENGIIVAKELDGTDAIGFDKDGRAVVDRLDIDTFMTFGNERVEIANINKYRQPFGVYLLTDRFYSDTRNSTKGLDIVIGSVSGEMRLGETVTGIVESKSVNDKAIDIPEGKIVITIDDDSILNGYGELYEKLDSLNPGDKVSVTNSVGNPGVWNNISYALGSVGGRLIRNGVVQDVDEAAAPRTAVGIKADGSVVFYTIDGRQNSSYGVRLKTLADRLLELGCVEALNYDGGGSTTINGIMPGDWHSTLLNSPSGSSERPCSNFFMLLNKSAQTSALAKLYLYPYNGYYLTGETEKFTVKGVDSGHYPVDITAPVTYSVDKEGCSIDSSGNAVFTGSGVCTVTATTGGISSSVRINITDSPDQLVFQNEDGWKDISSLTVARGEAVELSAVPFYKHTEHFVEDTHLKWEISEGVGFIDSDGMFVAPNKAGSGKIRVSMGKCSAEIPFTVTENGSLKNDGNYSEADFSFDNGVMKCELKNKFNIPISWAVVYIDGKAVESEVSGNVIKATVNDGKIHKIKILSDNILGTKTLAYYTVDGTFDRVFSDTSGHWADKYISHLAKIGITDYSYLINNQLYNPDMNMTRLDFAIMICKTLGYNIDDYASVLPEYRDMSKIPEACIPYIKVLFAEKIISGKGTDDGAYFAPDDNITRAEVAAIVGRVMPYGIRSGKVSATDVSDIPKWAIEGFNVLTRYNIISGYPDGSVKPNNNITRAECSRILYEIL